MITIAVENYNQFSQEYYDSIIEKLQIHRLECTCGHSACLSIHGHYWRSLLLPEGTVYLRILRLRCSECGKTHAVLPSSIVPYDRIPLIDQHKVISAFENGDDCYAVCEENPSVDENAVRAIIRRYRLHWLQMLLSEAIELNCIPLLVSKCFSFYSRQFMQLRRTAGKLFFNTT